MKITAPCALKASFQIFGWQMQIIKRSRVCVYTSERAQIAPQALRANEAGCVAPPHSGSLQGVTQRLRRRVRFLVRVAKKEIGTHKECLSLFGDPYGNRTHASALRGPRLSRLTNGPRFYSLDYYTIKRQVCQGVFKIFSESFLKLKYFSLQGRFFFSALDFRARKCYN